MSHFSQPKALFKISKSLLICIMMIKDHLWKTEMKLVRRGVLSQV